MMKLSQLSTTFERLFLSSETKKKIEKVILYIALISFFFHLLMIYGIKYGFINFLSESELMKNPISAIYTPFSFILIYEVYLLIYYLPKSFTTYITKQYEIITLIIIRKLFKDLSAIQFSTDWFDIKGDLQFTYDLLASLILFYLIYQFQKQGRRIKRNNQSLLPRVKRFIGQKKIIAVLLVPLFFIMALLTLISWSSEISLSLNKFPSFESINNLFFDEFFTVLILVDVILLLLSFFYTDQFHKIIRNSGFIVSTILIRLSFGVSGIMSTILILVAVLFGLLIIIIHNQYEKESVLPKNT
ncbi:MAG TPA: hypothetical protein DDY13_19280 [Cytophagales bacterium]|jgi:hypothetical protein|nr:hypothetical protein [Cytophagales bacterium]